MNNLACNKYTERKAVKSREMKAQGRNNTSVKTVLKIKKVPARVDFAHDTQNRNGYPFMFNFTAVTVFSILSKDNYCSQKHRKKQLDVLLFAGHF